MASRVLVVIPAWNEGKNLEAVIGELRRVRPGDDVLVVTPQSSLAFDESAAAAVAAGSG